MALRWGTMYSVNAGASGLYGGTLPYIFESGSTAAHGTGTRMMARKYENSPATAFASSGANDVRDFNRGVRFLTSVSNQAKAHSGFTWDKATNGVSAGVGTWDSEWTAFFARLAPSGGTSVGLKFSQAVDTSGANLLGSYGGLTEPEIELCIDHECDRPDKSTNGNATQYKAYVRHVHNLMVTAGIRNRFKINWCITEYGLNTRQATVDSFYPGDDVVDIIGVDFYGDFTSTWAYDGATKSFASAMAVTFAWMRAKHPTKPFNFPEFQEAESSNDTDMQNWYTGIGTTFNSPANADLNCIGIYLWCQASSKYQNYNQTLGDAGPSPNVAHAGKHAGIIAAITATGGNPVIGSVAGTIPAAPTGLSITLGSDGTTATASWTSAPANTPSITGCRIYLGDGVTTNLHRQDAAAGQPDHAVTTSYTFTGLTPGATYTWSVTWSNSLGNSGWATDTSGNLLSFTTIIPGSTGNTPSITTPATIVQDTTDTLEYDYSIGATDPHSLPLSYAWTFTSPSGVVFGPFSGASGTTPELNEPGNWSFSVVVSNTIPLTVPQSGTFPVTLPNVTASTKFFKWAKPQTGDKVRSLGPLLRGFMDDIDSRVHSQLYQKSTQNQTAGLVASAFPSTLCHSGNTQALTSGWAYWTSVVLEDDHFDEIWFLTKTQAQVGTGTQIAVYNTTGDLLPNGVYASTAVQTTLQGTVGAIKYSLSSDSLPAETGLTPGSILYILIKNVAATTAPQLCVSSSPGTAAKLGDFAAGQPTFGGWNMGAGTLPSQLPFASWTNQQQIWAGLAASDVNPTQ